MRMQERRLPLGYIWLMVTMLVIGTGVFSYTYRVNQVMRNFHHRAYEDEKDPRKQDSFRRFLTSIGANLTVPATGGETLTFTSPVTFTVYERFNTETKIRRGDTVSCDFITWSGEGGDSVRFLRIADDEKTREGTVSPRVAARLYEAALEQNGLTEQFRQETGEPLSHKSARESLRTIDRQIYDLGLYAPTDYPFDRSAFERILLLTGGSVILVFLVIITILPEWVDYLRYRAWLVDNNRDNSRRWKQVEGELPQFVSLRANADGGKPQPVYERPGVIQRMKALFSPVTRE